MKGQASSVHWRIQPSSMGARGLKTEAMKRRYVNNRVVLFLSQNHQVRLKIDYLLLVLLNLLEAKNAILPEVFVEFQHADYWIRSALVIEAKHLDELVGDDTYREAAFAQTLAYMLRLNCRIGVVVDQFDAALIVLLGENLMIRGDLDNDEEILYLMYRAVTDPLALLTHLDQLLREQTAEADAEAERIAMTDTRKAERAARVQARQRARELRDEGKERKDTKKRT